MDGRVNERVKASAPVDPDRSAEPGEDERGGGWRETAEALLSAILAPFAEIGMVSRMAYETAFWGIRPPYRWRQFIAAMEFIGVGSIFLITLTATFSGAVFGLQLVTALRDFGAQNQAGAVTGVAFSRELAPVFAALMVSSRAGSAMTTELGSMRVSGQIDALVTMAVSPIQYLVVPRVVAGFVMVPILTLLFDVVGMVGAWFVATTQLGLDEGIFLNAMAWQVDWSDVSQGLLKGAIFGIVITLVACRQGFHATGGAAGVGQATNRTVVHSAVAILCLDYIVSSIIIGEGLL